jgi:hypothetical protein
MADPRPCYCQRDDAPMVSVPAEGTWIVMDGEAEAVEIVDSDVTGFWSAFRKPKDEDHL